MRLVDADVLSYALLEDHVATPYSRPLILKALRGELEVYVLDTTLLEAYNTLFWYYRVRPREAVLRKLEVVARGLTVLGASTSGVRLALEENVPLGDAFLVATALERRIPVVVSNDSHVRRLAERYGLICENPIPEDVRRAMSRPWESGEHT